MLQSITKYTTVYNGMATCAMYVFFKYLLFFYIEIHIFGSVPVMN